MGSGCLGLKALPVNLRDLQYQEGNTELPWKIKAPAGDCLGGRQQRRPTSPGASSVPSAFSLETLWAACGHTGIPGACLACGECPSKCLGLWRCSEKGSAPLQGCGEDGHL